MEVPGMDEVRHPENHMTSAAAFVEGGVQDTCDDACSICLEAFCSSDPSTVTNCKHEFHLQCILEWCQRSSNCPMCWQAISLKDPDSQELLEGVERDRAFRLTPPRNATIFHHPTLGDFELRVGINDPDLEDRIMQHLAAAAAMGRTDRIARRDGSRIRSSAYSRQQFVVFSGNHHASSTNPSGLETESSLTGAANPSHLHMPASSSGSLFTPTTNYNRSYTTVSSSPNLESAGPSESFSDTWKSRLNSMSMKYKDSISKSTRGWTEKLFSRSSSVADIGSEVRREVNAGIAIVSRMMERLETRDDDRASRIPPTTNDVDSSGHSNHGNRDTASNETPSNGNSTASFATSSISS